MKKKYSISIILSVYNRKKIFHRALESLLNQSYQDFEGIIIDDGSTDNLEYDISKIINYDYRFTYIKQSNRKIVKSLNRALKLCCNNFVTFLDSDDEYEKHHLEERIKYFKSNKNAELIYSNAFLAGDEKNFYVPDAEDKRKLIHLDKCVIGATIFAKKYVFEKTNGFRDVYSYDSDFIKRAEKMNINIKKINSPTYIYHRDSEDSFLTQKKIQLGL